MSKVSPTSSVKSRPNKSPDGLSPLLSLDQVPTRVIGIVRGLSRRTHRAEAPGRVRLIDSDQSPQSVDDASPHLTGLIRHGGRIRIVARRHNTGQSSRRVPPIEGLDGDDSSQIVVRCSSPARRSRLIHCASDYAGRRDACAPSSEARFPTAGVLSVGKRDLQ
jgi:hypothetical protein